MTGASASSRSRKARATPISTSGSSAWSRRSGASRPCRNGSRAPRWSCGCGCNSRRRWSAKKPTRPASLHFTVGSRHTGHAPCARSTPLPNRVDPITVSVIQHRLLTIVEEIGEAMLRTSYSQILNSSRDFSTAICDLDGRLIAQAEHVPIHVGALPWAARSVRDFFGSDIHQGDVFLLNDPYRGGNPLPAFTAFVPVSDGDKPVYWSINRAHQSDIGGATHGSYNAAATEIWQEGLPITPLRLYHRGEPRRRG